METQIWIPLLLTVLAGLSTGIGSLITLFVKKFDKRLLYISLGLSSGVMVYVSFVELLPSAIETIGFLYANLAFFAGIIIILIIEFTVPHEYIEENVKMDKQDKKLMKAGMYTAIGLAIHNFPEGLAVFISALNDITIGVPLAFAIALHNIPEGLAVAMPVYHATRSKSKAFWYSFLAGVVEPIAAIVCVLILMPYINEFILSLMLAFVAGIMVFISFDELLPLSYRHEEDSHLSVFGLFIGMAIMAASLYLL